MGCPMNKKEVISEENISKEKWVTIGSPGYFGKSREEQVKNWNDKYGEGKWRIAWETPQGNVLTYEDIIKEYIEGYAEYFRQHPEEAKFLTDNYSFAYDKEMITKEDAFDPYALYQKPGKVNQFHHVALNISLEKVIGIPFKGSEPIKVRAGKPETPIEQWPDGWKWHPGLIQCIHPELIKDVDFPNQWWGKGSIEDLYQSDKVFQIKKF